MINLLPPDTKRELRAARSNTLLVRYNIFLVGALVFMMIALGIVYVYLSNTKAGAEQAISESNAKVANYALVEAQAAEFRQNLQTAKQILDQEVNYSKVVLEFASLMPAGTILDTLTLDSATFGTPITLNAKAKNYESALALKDSFQNSSLFTDVHFQSISGVADAGSPVSVSLNVTIKKEAAK